ncbi:MAG: cytochrome P460 family protein [Oryzomonas sp.]|jgi:hypothetical protein
MKAQSVDSARTVSETKTKRIPAIVIVVALLAAFGGIAISAQDRYTVKVPNGLAFSEFRGYEDWKVVAVSHAESLNLIEVIVANPVMIDAYQAGVHDIGKPFPDGCKMAKIHWNAIKSAEAPGPTIVPGTLHDIDFMVRDSKRFADSGNWGYAEFDYASVSDTFTPHGSGTNCGYACHTIVKGKDYVFTGYPKR